MAARGRFSEFQSAVLCGVLGCATPVLAVDIAVIVARDASPQTLNEGTLRDIYLKKVFLDDSGRKYIPLNLPADAPLRQAFTLALFHKGSDELQDYWNQNYFHGITPPYVLGSQDAVARFVAQTPGAIGYVVSCHVHPGVRQVLSLPLIPAAGVALEGECPPSAGDSTAKPE